MRLVLKLLIVVLAVGTFQSCVSKKKYDELLAAKEATDQALAETQEQLKTLQEEKDALEAEYNSEKERLNGEIASIKSDLDATKAEVGQVKEKLSMTEAELNKLKEEINGMFAAYENSGLTLDERNGELFVVTSNPVNYRSGSASLSKDQRDAIDALAEKLKANPDVHVLVTGHTDTDKLKEGAPWADNWDLSISRAKTVVKRLISKGVSPDQLSIAGDGENDPVSDNDSSDGKAKNRRTEIQPNPKLGGLFKSN